MRRLIILILLFPLLLTAALPVSAQGPVWCKTWSGSSLPLVYGGGYGAPEAGGIPDASYTWSGHTYHEYIRQIPVDVSLWGQINRTVTTVEFTFDNALVSGGGSVDDMSVLPVTYDMGTSSISGNTMIITVNAHIFNFGFALYPNTDGSSPGYLHTMTLRGEGTIPTWMGESNCDGGGGTEPALPDAARPLVEADEASVGQVLYDLNPIASISAAHDDAVYDASAVLYGNDLNSVAAWSAAPGAHVHAAEGGHVQSIRRLNWSDCIWGQYGDIGGTPQYVGWESGEVHPCQVNLYDFGAGTEYADVALASYYIDPTNASLVTIVVGEYFLTYLVRNAEQYVTVGDDILQGCVLGETVGLTGIPETALNWGGVLSSALSYITSSWLGFLSGLDSMSTTITPEVSYGYTNLQLTNAAGDGVELLSSLTVVPTNEDRCNNTGEYAGCLTDNPRMLSAGTGWQTVGNVEWLEPGVVLDPGESISQVLNLDPAESYTLTALAQSPGVEGELMGILGTNSERQTVAVEWTSLQYEAAPVGDGDAGGFWTVSVVNTGDTVVTVQSVCVTAGSAPTNPNSCYFTNHSFESGTAGWTVSEGVESSDQSLLVPDDGTISQTVHLYPKADGAASYQLTIYADWWYSGTIAPVGPEASVQYEWPSGTGYVTLEPEIVSGGLAYGMGSIVYRATISVATETTGTLNIRVQTTSGGTGMTVYGLALTEACLSGKFQQDTGGTVPVLTGDCSYVTRPRTNDPAAWIQWQWLKLNQFFKCDLMVLLNKFWKTVRDFMTMVGWSIRYIQASMTNAASWSSSQLFPWLNGHFRNIAIGQVTNIEQGSSSTIWDVLLALISQVLSPLTDGILSLVNILTGAAGLLFSVITGVIVLGISMLTQAMGYAHIGQKLISALIVAYNSATPTPIPGMPSCTGDPKSNPFCISIWVLDNTIFSGPGALVLPLILGILSIHLVIWVVGEMKQTLREVGAAS
jgi:hypothetical protein